MDRRVFAACPAVLFAAAVFLGIAPGTAPAQEGWTGHAGLFAGQKFLSGDDWGELDDQPAGGVEVDFRQGSWPVFIAIDVIFSSDSDEMLVPGVGRVLRTESDIVELDLGIRKYWVRDPFFRPFLGGGISFVRVDAQSLGVEDDDTAPGFWLDAGIDLDLTDHLVLGAELRYSWARVEVFGEDRQAGGLTAGAKIGFRW